ALEDLDALDRVRVQVVQARGTGHRAARVVDAHAVDVDERLVGLREGGAPADADLPALARAAAAGEGGDARLAALQHLRDVLDRALLEVRRVHRGDGVPEGTPLGGGTGAGDDHLVQRD